MSVFIPMKELTGDLLQQIEEVEIIMLYGSDDQDVYENSGNDLKFGITIFNYLKMSKKCP
ncbi:MAG TPA: hypothetical protein VK184_21905 [Nostocaceae cyanobacterium]|nr:hypothetical protein [Nostocaceae cyanobacterium]